MSIELQYPKLSSSDNSFQPVGLSFFASFHLLPKWEFIPIPILEDITISKPEEDNLRETEGDPISGF